MLSKLGDLNKQASLANELPYFLYYHSLTLKSCITHLFTLKKLGRIIMAVKTNKGFASR